MKDKRREIRCRRNRLYWAPQDENGFRTWRRKQRVRDIWGEEEWDESLSGTRCLRIWGTAAPYLLLGQAPAGYPIEVYAS
jgi:hypothetical protein